MVKKILEVSVYPLILVAFTIISIFLCCQGNPYKLSLGIAGIILTFGECLYLIPKIIADISIAFESQFALGVGKACSSVTRVLFMLMLYHICAIFYKMSYNFVTGIVYFFATLAVIMIVLPRNQWSENKEHGLIWSIILNTPMILLGITLIIIYAVNINYAIWNPLNFFWIGILFFQVSCFLSVALQKSNSNWELLNVVSYLSLISILVLGFYMI